MLDTSVTSTNFYFLIAVFQGFILSLIIIFKRPIKRTNVYFGLVVFLFSLSLLHGVLEKSIHTFNIIFPFPMEYGFAIGPLTYLHFKNISEFNYKFKIRDIFHFIPSILIDIIFFLAFFNYARVHIEWANANTQNIQLLFLFIAMLFIVQMGYYYVAIYQLVNKIELRLKNIALPIKRWFMISIAFGIIILAFHIIAVPMAILNIHLFDSYDYLVYNPTGIIKAIGIYCLGYLYLLKYADKVDKYGQLAENIKFSKDEITEKRYQLKKALEFEEIFRDQRLNIEKLALCLGWPIRDVTIVIGQSFNTNFNDLINKYRIKAFKDSATKLDSRKYSIMGMAQAAGFNSKASFYRAFKKECGQTPSEYLASHNLK